MKVEIELSENMLLEDLTNTLTALCENGYRGGAVNITSREATHYKGTPINMLEIKKTNISVGFNTNTKK